VQKRTGSERERMNRKNGPVKIVEEELEGHWSRGRKSKGIGPRIHGEGYWSK
jgi:hypothetical protein